MPRSRHDKLSDHISRKNHGKITENYGEIMKKSWPQYNIKFSGKSRSRHDILIMVEEKP